MATITSYIQGSSAATHRGHSNHAHYVPTEVIVDFALTPAAAADVIQLFYVPPGMQIDNFGTEILEPTGEAMTFDVGSVAVPNSLVEVGNGNAAVGTLKFGNNAAGFAVDSLPVTTNRVFSMTLATGVTIVAGKIRCRLTMSEVICKS